MRFAWAVRIPRADVSSCLWLRRLPDVEVREEGSILWFRGTAAQDRLRLAPCIDRFSVLEDGRLVREGERLPGSRLPSDGWTSFAGWVEVKFPRASLPGTPERRVEMRLVSGGSECEPNALMGSIEAWAAYADSAPQVRLDALRFAMDASGRVIIAGRPLPPLVGERFVETDGIAVPCGLEWRPAVDAATLRKVLGLGPGDWAIFDREAACEIVKRGSFVPASRSAVRLSERSRA